MKGYLLSLKRQYVKHYGEKKAIYVATLLATFALPLIVAVWMRDSTVAVGTSSVVMLIALVFVIDLSTRGMWKREQATLTFTLPVSVFERYSFILLNTLVWCVVLNYAAIYPALEIADRLYPHYMSDEWVAHYLFCDDLSSWVGLISTATIFVLAAVNSRYKPLVSVIIALAVVWAVQLFLAEIYSAEEREAVLVVVNLIFIPVAWVVGYFMLKKFELK